MRGSITLESFASTRNVAPPSRYGLIVAAALLVCAGIYWPGLRGGFTYDDNAFLLGNQLVQVTSLRLSDWTGAAMSFPDGSHQGRWLGMLSFAANHFFTGLDPFWLKLTNLCIHLCNGILLFLALRVLLVLASETRPAAVRQPTLSPGTIAALVAALWLVLPINLTAVLYVSQRLESLSNTFVFFGLWWYLRSRLALWRGEGGSTGLWLSLFACTGVGVLVKESAVLLPLYALCAEFVLTGLKDRDGQWSRRVLAVYGTLLLIPLIVGLVWLGGWVGDPRSYGRSFDVLERLLTEARVLMHYIAWTLAPSLDALTLYHDDIALSRSLLDPPTTLAALVAIAGMFGIAMWQRTRHPLLAIGILWYFAGHLLTGTIIPLMLAFEHRNYFPSVGLLLAVTALFALVLHLRMRVLAIIALCLFGFYSFTTALLALEWSEPQRLTWSQSAKRPNSPGAQYDRATLMLTSMTRSDGTPMFEDAMLVLDRARKLTGAGILFEQRMITETAKRHRPIDPEWWTAIEAKLAAKPANASDSRSLSNLNQCYISALCGKDPAPLKRSYDAALAHGNSRATLLSTHAEFAWYVLHDKALAERTIRQTVADAPKDINARRNLVILLIHTGQLKEAREVIAVMQQANHLGIFDRFIDSLVEAIEAKEAEGKIKTPPSVGVDKG